MHKFISNYSRSDNPCCEHALGVVGYTCEGNHLTHHNWLNKILSSGHHDDSNLGISVHLHRQKNAQSSSSCAFFI